MSRTRRSRVSRRRFLAQSTAAGIAALSAPALVTADKAGTKTVVGDGDHRYEANHDWAQLPSQYSWQTTHNVAIDGEGLVYVIHEGRADKTDHPSIFVFTPDGRFVRAFGQPYQGGGHGIEVRTENGQQFLYVCAYQHLKLFAKLDLKGEVVWQQFAPMQSGVYADGEDSKPQKVWGRDRFLPTNFAFLDDGGFFLADGYGSYTIHRYDKEGKWLSCFGGAGEGQGKFNTPHGLWIDRRPGRERSLVVADRAHHTLQRLTLDGQHLETLTGFGLPANVDTWKDLMVVPELIGCVSLLDSQNKIVARLGDDAERIKEDKSRKIRGDASLWQAGKFVHPHDACFDADGNIYVAEWVATGRVTKLTRLA
jgi:hypothetical protein